MDELARTTWRNGESPCIWLRKDRRAGVEVVVVHAEDLSLEGVSRKIGTLLPLRDLAGYELAIKHLERRSAIYRREAASGRMWQKASP